MQRMLKMALLTWEDPVEDAAVVWRLLMLSALLASAALALATLALAL